MRGLGSTVALILVLAGLGAYIYFVDSKRPAAGSEARDKVFAVESGQINEVTLTAGGQTTVLAKQDSGWQLTSPTATAADPTEASSLATNIASLEETRVVDENAADLTPYGLAEPHIKLAFKAEGGKSGEVYLGDKTPTQGDLYAVKPGSTRVFLVSSYLETTFDKKPFDLRDKRVVTFERDKVDGIELKRGSDVLKMTRSGSDWKVDQPVTTRGDYAAVEGLLTRLSTAGMAAIVSDDASDLKAYGLDNPSMTITVGTGSSQAALEVGGTNDTGQHYARDRARKMVFTLDTTLADDLTKGFDEYYKKDLFESRPFSTDRIRITRSTGGTAKTWAFAKTSADGTDKWQVTPEGGQAADVEQARMDELLGKLSTLRASSFADRGRRTGLDAPVLNIGVSYDNGKFERVKVGQVEDTYYGNREGDQPVGVLATADVEAAFKALDEAVAPPPPATATPAPKETPKP